MDKQKLVTSKLIWGMIIVLHFFVQVHCISYNCEVVGKFSDPEDEHKYHQCFYLYGSLVYLHNLCPLKTCYNQTIKYCNKESCRDYVNTVSKSYDCSTRHEKSYPCTKQGYIADPNDGSYYYNCVQVRAPDGELEWESWCYTCHSIDKTCFSDALKTCVPCGKGGGTGGGGGSTGGGGTAGGGTTAGDGKPLLTYNCKGYNELSFPCEKYAVAKSTGDAYIGMFANPGDESTYYQCYYKGGKAGAVCAACNKENHEVYHIDMKKCVPNKIHPTPPPIPKMKPYDCSTRSLRSYPCTKGGFVADPTDNTVFYLCVQNGSDWESRCYSCNSKLKTCYNNVLQACVSCDYNEGDGHSPGGSGTGGGGTGGVGTGGSGTGDGGTGAVSTTTYDCDGYGGFSIPCQQLGSGSHAHPGDTSVYFNCAKQGGKDVAICRSCNRVTEQTYNVLTRKCETPHGHGIIVTGTVKSYDCSGYTSKSYPCSKQGYFPHPKDPTVYFHCYIVKTDSDGSGGGLRIGAGLFGIGGGIQIGGDSLLKIGGGIGPMKGGFRIGGSSKKTSNTQKWLSKCYICNSQKKSCFKEDVQRCVNGCTNGGGTLSYDCSGYDQKVTPETSCDVLKKKGQKFFGLFGDRSVYFQCVKISGKWYYYCYSCTPRSCYDQERQICVLGTCDKNSKSKPKGRMFEGEDIEIPVSQQENEVARLPQKSNPKTRCLKYTTKRYKCTNEGYFPYPQDPTVYFNCTRGEDGILKSKCRICNQLNQGCFKSDIQSCDHGCGFEVGNYDCSETPGLINTAFLCADHHSRGQKYFGISADKTVYFECEKVREIWYHNCIECPSNQCFDQSKQQCEACHG